MFSTSTLGLSSKMGHRVGQCGFPQSLQVNSGTSEPPPKLRHDSFLPQALKSINHKSVHHFAGVLISP